MTDDASTAVARGSTGEDRIRTQILIGRDPHQTRVAILEDERLAEISIERTGEQGIVGNVYKARVHRVLPGMEAAFVDIGTSRDAFLHARDVRVRRDDPAHLEPDSDAPAAEDGAPPPIDALLSEGDEIVVQVTKDPLPGKGPRVTMDVSLPGRYLVLLPTEEQNGVSRRIDDPEERDRLARIVDSLGIERGLIVRTAGRDAGRDDFVDDVEFLLDLWESIEERGRAAEAPMLLHSDLDLPLRTVRDLFGDDVDELVVDDPRLHTAVVELLERTAPELVSRVRLHRGPRPLMVAAGVEEAVERALEPRVGLPSGGSIVVTQTEALTAIDVNTGRYVGGAGFEQTILTTNLEAVKEIVHQIRLRDLGGIIVLDLIDMEVAEHRREVFAALERELARDRVKSRMLTISEFGLVEITRKRSRPSLDRILTRACPYCDGSGRIRSAGTVVTSLRRHALGLELDPSCRVIRVRLHPDVAARLAGPDHAVLTELEVELGVEIEIEADDDLHHESFEFSER